MTTLLFQMVVPVTIAAVALYAMGKRVDVYDALTQGAGEGLGTLLAPFLTQLGVPPETVGLLLVRPVSGNAALGVGTELIQTYGPDSLIGRTAAVMLGSTETTFYTIAVYFGAAGIKKTRYAVPAALCADVAAFLAASWAVRVVFG